MCIPISRGRWLAIATRSFTVLTAHIPLCVSQLSTEIYRPRGMSDRVIVIPILKLPFNFSSFLLLELQEQFLKHVPNFAILSPFRPTLPSGQDLK